MKKRQFLNHALAWGMILLMALPPGVFAQQSAAPATFKQEELDQILAPIALYPDSLLSQILVAATYPQDVAEAAACAENDTR